MLGEEDNDQSTLQTARQGERRSAVIHEVHRRLIIGQRVRVRLSSAVFVSVVLCQNSVIAYDKHIADWLALLHARRQRVIYVEARELHHRD